MTREFIYVIEDDPHIQQLLEYNLASSGYRTAIAGDGESALATLSTGELPDLIILDIMLPGKDGMEICKNLRMNEKTTHIPVIMLTAKSEEFDKVLGLELGADDYVTKPFSIRELTARIKAVLRRSTAAEEDTRLKNTSGMGKDEEKDNDNNKENKDSKIIRFGDITINIAKHEVFKGKQIVELTLKEFELLKILAANRGIVLSRDLLLEKVWGFDFYGETRTVDVHIHYLRQKIGDDESNPLYIETVRGIGYRLNDRIPEQK